MTDILALATAFGVLWLISASLGKILRRFKL